MQNGKLLDRGSLTVTETGQGYLRADALLSRSGVFTYRNADGTERNEYRPPDEVFDAASLATLSLVPFTNDHPPQFLTAENTKGLTIGVVGENIKQAGQWIAAKVQVTDADGIKIIKSGKVEISLGYERDLDPTPGVTNDGEHYDGIQRNIRYNHAALVDKGRAGGSRLMMDAAEQIQPKGKAVKKITVKGITYEVDPQLADALDGERADADALLAEASKETDIEKARADQAEENLGESKKLLDSAMSPDAVAEKVAQRLGLERAAGQVLDSADLAKQSDSEIRSAVIIKECPGADLEGKSDIYIQARFDHVMDSIEAKPDATDEARNKVDAGGDQKVRSSIQDAREQRAKDNQKRSDLAPGGKA